LNGLLKVLPIYVSLFIAGAIFSFVNITFWLSKIKSGVYVLPFIDHVFQKCWTFTLAAWCFNVPSYIIATLFVGYAYKTSVANYGILYSALVISNITSVFTMMFFMYIQTGEVPNKKEWMSLVLVLIASLLLTNSRSN